MPPAPNLHYITRSKPQARHPPINTGRDVNACLIGLHLADRLKGLHHLSLSQPTNQPTKAHQLAEKTSVITKKIPPTDWLGPLKWDRMAPKPKYLLDEPLDELTLSDSFPGLSEWKLIDGGGDRI